MNYHHQLKYNHNSIEIPPLPPSSTLPSLSSSSLSSSTSSLSSSSSLSLSSSLSSSSSFLSPTSVSFNYQPFIITPPFISHHHEQFDQKLQPSFEICREAEDSINRAMKYNFKAAATCQYPSKNNSKIDSTSDSMTMIDLEQQMRPPPQQQQLINSVNTNKLVQNTSRISNTTENKINNNDFDNNNDYTTIHNIIPNLMSEKEKKAKFVEKLVDMTCLIINVIWAELSVNPNTKVIPLKIFVRETLRRSRTSYSTLQATLFYLFRIKPQIDLITANANGVNQDNQKQQKLLATSNNNNNNPATCCRRMFLAALIVASKYLQDCNYSNSAWSKISGLPVGEINANEICFLQLIDYNLFISEDIFRRWSSFLLKHIQDTLHNGGSNNNHGNNHNDSESNNGDYDNNNLVKPSTNNNNYDGMKCNSNISSNNSNNSQTRKSQYTIGCCDACKVRNRLCDRCKERNRNIDNNINNMMDIDNNNSNFSFNISIANVNNNISNSNSHNHNQRYENSQYSAATEFQEILKSEGCYQRNSNVNNGNDSRIMAN